MNSTIRKFITESEIELIRATGHITAIGRDVQERRLDAFAKMIITECADLAGDQKSVILKHFEIK